MQILPILIHWEFWHNSFDADDYMGFNSTTPKYETGGPWNNTLLPTSEHFTVSSDMDVNRTGDNYGSISLQTPTLDRNDIYTGAGDGTTVDCGFKPGWVLIKQATGTNNAWRIYDNKRGNGTHQCEIYPNYAYPEDCGQIQLISLVPDLLLDTAIIQITRRTSTSPLQKIQTLM